VEKPVLFPHRRKEVRDLTAGRFDRHDRVERTPAAAGRTCAPEGRIEEIGDVVEGRLPVGEGVRVGAWGGR
jgi:hypothetical protein